MLLILAVNSVKSAPIPKPLSAQNKDGEYKLIIYMNYYSLFPHMRLDLAT